MGQRSAGGRRAVDHHGGYGLAGRRLERRLPTLVDLDQLEQGPDHAFHLGQALCPGPGAGVVQRQGQGVDPSRRIVVRAVGD